MTLTLQARILPVYFKKQMSEETIIHQTEYYFKGSGKERKAFWLEVYGWAQQLAHLGKVPDGCKRMRIEGIKDWVKDNHGRNQGSWGLIHADGKWKAIQAASEKLTTEIKL